MARHAKTQVTKWAFSHVSPPPCTGCLLASLAPALGPKSEARIPTGSASFLRQRPRLGAASGSRNGAPRLCTPGNAVRPISCPLTTRARRSDRRRSPVCACAVGRRESPSARRAVPRARCPGRDPRATVGPHQFGPGFRLRVVGRQQLQQLTGPLTFLPGTAPLKLERPYRGQFVASASNGKVRIVNHVGLEAYLFGVVPGEMPFYRLPEAPQGPGGRGAKSAACARPVRLRPLSRCAQPGLQRDLR